MNNKINFNEQRKTPFYLLRRKEKKRTQHYYIDDQQAWLVQDTLGLSCSAVSRLLSTVDDENVDRIFDIYIDRVEYY